MSTIEKNYDTWSDSIKAINRLKFNSKEEFDKFMLPKNEDISIDEIDEETIKMVAKNDPDIIE